MAFLLENYPLYHQEVSIFSLIGVINALSMSHPYLSRDETVAYPILYRLAHSARHKVSPSIVNKRFSALPLQARREGIGSLRALSIDHPLVSLFCNERGFMPNSSAQSVRHCVLPRCVIMLFCLVFLACRLRVSHTQFSLEYPWPLSFLSIVCSGDGRIPISCMKAEKSFHRSQTLIPLSP